MQILLSKGAHSKVYIDENSPNIVIKENNNVKSDFGYLHRQERAYKIIDTIRTQNEILPVLLPELIEIQDSDDKQIVKERLIPGRAFNTGMYRFKLSDKQKNNVAKKIAELLNMMHSGFDFEAPKESIKNIFSARLNNSDDIIAKFAGKLPKDIEARLKQAEDYVLSSGISDEFIVMTHKDLRTQNIMYDENTDNIAIIDFELAGLDNVYRDFVAVSPASSMPWDFTKRVIDFYNKIPNKKYPIKINPEKVQNMLFYGVLHEFARCIKPGDVEKASQEDMALIYRKLEIVAGIKLDVKSAFENAINKVCESNTNMTIQNNINRDDR